MSFLLRIDDLRGSLTRGLVLQPSRNCLTKKKGAKLPDLLLLLKKEAAWSIC